MTLVSRTRPSTNGGRKRSFDRDPGSALIREVALYPVRECLINKHWREQKMASIVISRTRPDGCTAFGAFAVDIGCLGVKSAFVNLSISETEYLGIVDRVIEASEVVVPCEPALAVKLVQGGHEYAAKLGFEPDPDYFYSREIFGTIDPESCDETIEYGDEGKPLYIIGPYDDAERVLEHLSRTLGPGGFHVVLPMDS